MASLFPAISWKSQGAYLNPAQAPKSHLGSAIKNGVSKTLLMNLSPEELLIKKLRYTSMEIPSLKSLKLGG